jgi:DNA phosphorothioation-dependent restriction protein DptG
MCCVFLMPLILRPLDFLSNVRNYMLGLLSYLFMMPTFINIMQIYAMCNLHDISWGNRPTTQGVEAVTINVQAQERLKQDY